jgi:hypothetical protein
MTSWCPGLNRIVFERAASCKLVFADHYAAINAIASLQQYTGLKARLANSNYSELAIPEVKSLEKVKYISIIYPYWVSNQYNYSLY